MGRAQPMVIGGEHFRTREEAKQRVRALIDKYDPGRFLVSDDKDFALALFRNHTEYERKVGGGITEVEVRLDIYGNKHFQIHRADGTSEDISWVHCIKHGKA